MTRAELQFLVQRAVDQVLTPAATPPSASPKPTLPPADRSALTARSSSPVIPVVELAATIDHTNLKPEALRRDILQLCHEALEWSFFSVCVHSIWVPLAHQVLRGSDVKVCTVTGFPTGAVPSAVKVLEAEIATRNGAREIDMVLPVGLLRMGELDVVREDILAVSRACSGAGALLKVILESSALTDEQVAIGCALARLGGAQFVKTSTGLHPAGGAKAEHVALMRQVAGSDMGVKAAGGIRTLEDAQRMLGSGASRLGTSASVSIVSAFRERTRG